MVGVPCDWFAWVIGTVVGNVAGGKERVLWAFSATSFLLVVAGLTVFGGVSTALLGFVGKGGVKEVSSWFLSSNTPSAVAVNTIVLFKASQPPLPWWGRGKRDVFSQRNTASARYTLGPSVRAAAWLLHCYCALWRCGGCQIASAGGICGHHLCLPPLPASPTRLDIPTFRCTNVWIF